MTRILHWNPKKVSCFQWHAPIQKKFAAGITWVTGLALPETPMSGSNIIPTSCPSSSNGVILTFSFALCTYNVFAFHFRHAGSKSKSKSKFEATTRRKAPPAPISKARSKRLHRLERTNSGYVLSLDLHPFFHAVDKLLKHGGFITPSFSCLIPSTTRLQRPG